MESILSLIEKSQANLPDARAQLIKRMTPLVKKYSSKIHFMEYEDALQELYITLLETIPYLNINNGEGKCLSYIKTAVVNRYYNLCKHYLAKPKSESLDNYSLSLESPPIIDDSYYDVISYIHSFAPESLRFKILFKSFYEEKTDKEISLELKVSRQYVNRLKKKLIYGYFEQK